MDDFVKSIGGLFERPGRKIQGYAIGLFVISCSILALTAVATIIMGLHEGFLGFVIAVVIAIFEFGFGVFGAYVFSLYLFGFGDLVHETAINRATNALILKELMKNQVSDDSASNASKPAVSTAPCQQKTEASSQAEDESLRIADNEFTDTYWICGNCKTKNLSSRDDCWACGNKK